MSDPQENYIDNLIGVTCPHCACTFDMRVRLTPAVVIPTPPAPVEAEVVQPYTEVGQ